MEAPPSPLSSRAQWRDLQFYGLLPEMFFPPSIKPHQISLTLTRLKPVRNFNRPSLIVPLGTNPHPMPSRPCELDHIRTAGFARELVTQFLRPLFPLGPAPRPPPPAPRSEGRRSGNPPPSNASHARPPHPNRFGG